jgi:hypothetical protein
VWWLWSGISRLGILGLWIPLVRYYKSDADQQARKNMEEQITEIAEVLFL